MILWECIGAGTLLTIAVIVAIKLIVDEIRKDIEIYKKRNHWRKRFK